MKTATDLHAQAPCGGCGAKVSADALGEVLRELQVLYPRATPLAAELDDAVQINAGAPMLQSLDALRSLVDDPWRMGRIAAQHALSDLYASGAQPHSAQALIALPFAAKALLRRDLRLVLSGALSVFDAVGCRLVGGHSMQGPEMQLGFAVNGTLDDGPALSKRGGINGDKLILTRGLGSGALFAAHMQSRADGRDVEAALLAMEAGNAAAGRAARESGCRALTDVTGFGLAGHLLEMLDPGVEAHIDIEVLPVIAGALEAMQAGIFSTLHADNRDAVMRRCRLPRSPSLRTQLLFDPQTSGGLLMVVPPERAVDTLAALRVSDPQATVIGELLPSRDEGSAIVVSNGTAERP